MENVILFVDGALLALVSIISIILMMRSFDSFDDYDQSDRNPFLSLFKMLLLTIATVVFIFMMPSALFLFFGLAASLDINQFDGKTLMHVRNQGLQELPNPKTPFLAGFLITFPLLGRGVPALMNVLGNRKVLAAAADEISDQAIKEFFLYDIQKFRNQGPIELAIDLCSGSYEISGKINRSLKTPDSIHKNFTSTYPFRMDPEKSKGSFLFFKINYTTDKKNQSRNFAVGLSGKLGYGFSSQYFSDSVNFSMPLSEHLGYMNLCERLKRSSNRDS